MINYDRKFEDMELYCDTPGCEMFSDFSGEWKECLDIAKAMGWRVRMVDGEWKHYCPRHSGPKMEVAFIDESAYIDESVEFVWPVAVDKTKP